ILSAAVLVNHTISAASVTVTPATATIPPGGTVQLTATTKDAAGNVLVGRAVTWASANTAVATVSAGGLVTGAATGGPVLIAATSEGKSGTAGITVAVPGAGKLLYVPNQAGNNILIFAAGASGNVPPIATIAVASPCTSYGVALDGAGNLYVTNFGCNNVLIFAAGSGNATLIAGGNTGLTDPAGIAL